MTDKLTQLSRAIGYFFKDEGVLCEALTHSSYKKSGKADYDNERYEFLGDRVLNLVISDYFFDRGENDNEGELTQLLSNCHDGKTLSDMGYKLELQKYLYIDLGQIGRGFKEQSGSLSSVREGATDNSQEDSPCPALHVSLLVARPDAPMP